MIRIGEWMHKGLTVALLVTVAFNCVEKQEEGIIFCTDSLFPFFCPSAGKCCSLPFYGKNLTQCYATISECGTSGQSCESCNIEPNNKLAATFIYANWDCGGDTQCEIDLGAANGTAGPFCDNSACKAWGDKYIPGGYACQSTPTHTPNIGSPPDEKCFTANDI